LVTRRQPHDRWHDAWTLVLATATVLLIWAVWEMTETQTPAPVEPPQSTVEPDSRAAAIRAPSRDDGRTPLQGAPVPDTSGRPEDAGKRTRPIVGQTLRCIRWHESRGQYDAFNGLEHYGAYQLSASYSDDWARKYGYGKWAHLTADQWPRDVQDGVAVALFAEWPGAWATLGACS
jgi:hypothetical protein